MSRKRTLASPFLPRARPAGFLRGATLGWTPLAFAARTATALRAHTAAQCIHETDDLCRFALPRRFDLLAGLLLLQQLLERIS
jgi:hypothetical protein